MNSLIYLSILLLGMASNIAYASTNFTIYPRTTVSLDGEWKIIVDPYENGYYNYRYEPFDEQKVPPTNAFFTNSKMQNPSDLIEYDFDSAQSLQVPGDWNTQTPSLYYYEGSVWYRKLFDAPAHRKKERIFIYFGAANYRADVYLNGKKLGVHVGGFTPFYYEVTDKLLNKGNALIVKVDNKRHAEAVPTLNTDWWNYGGITRSVQLAVVPEQFIRDYHLELSTLEGMTLTGEIWVEGASAGKKVQLQIPELGIKQTLTTNDQGTARVKTPLPKAKVKLWSPDNPKRYKIIVKNGADSITDHIGLRTIETRGKQLLLNGKPIFLRGISIHEEYSAHGGGRVRNVREAQQLLLWAKELGCNFVRLAHYPHNEDMVQLADSMGLMVWSEIPVYWTIQWNNESTYQLAEQQLTSMVERDRNRAAVIIWSLANETPVSGARNRFLSRLASKTRTLDPTRLLSAAMEKHYLDNDPKIAVVEDPLAELVDLVSFNEYIGWYDGLPDKATSVTWQIPYDKPVFISEFGGGARYGYHGAADTRWTEEFQEELYRKTLSMLEKIDGYAGVSPWILADFRSPRRLLSGIQNEYNRKGLYSEKGEKKKAFFVLQEYYRKKMTANQVNQ